ncbi:hypothetical protein CBR_g40987 [Chara braunii]|uniref:Myb/SANT-like DNA-binding domain-containing protein n=1 Tax=Chara braunii TaxID=69332 RepID=A0A388LUT3_CHABU|nr:hypothetical protein CBR_g40987 [Chara braunii]|eukprot:GBG86084.1 hypothetical protein CBR_g40987 [Chara braunii]
MLPPPLAMPSPAPRQRVAAPAANTSSTRVEESGRQVWESYRQQMHRLSTENKTNEVPRMRVGSDGDASDSQRASGDESPDVLWEDEAEDADELEIRPMAVRGRGRGGGRHQHKVVSHAGHESKGFVGEKGDKHPTWSVEKMLKLTRAMRDQQAHFAGMPHNYGRMRNKESKQQDLHKRLVEVGVNKTTDNIDKKWDNLFQQYKKVQRYQNTSGAKNFFNLCALRTEEGFDFRMNERVYLEIDNMSKANKTIYPDNLANTSSCCGV